ncbi:hypothetical protein [Ochrobactrum sp. S1502_03]|uniref:hypothetical protein n=1 Tax=Ochrobactrum sp. S1502_03 TaxID=3108451 RepID=UPI00320BBB25
MEVVKVETELQAWKLLDALLSGEQTAPKEPLLFDIKKWANVHIYLPDTPIEGSISPTMMKAFLELQEAINRTYTLVSADTTDLRHLTNIERNNLEFRVKVEKGSSGYTIDLGEIVQKIGIEAVSKMTPEMLMYTVLGTALIVGGTAMFKSWLAAKTEDRKSQVDLEKTKEMLSVQREAISQGTENVRIMAELFKKVPILNDIEAVTSVARGQIVKSVGDEGGGKLFDTNVDSELAAEVTTQIRQQSSDVVLKGNYKVVRVDTSVSDGFSVKLLNENDGSEVTASLLDALVSQKHKSAIQEAEWGKGLVYVEIKARKINNRIIDAIITDAKPV